MQLPGMSPQSLIREHECAAGPGPGVGAGVAQTPPRVQHRAPVRPGEGLEAGLVAQAEPPVHSLGSVGVGEGEELSLFGLVENGGQAAPLGLARGLSLLEDDGSDLGLPAF